MANLVNADYITIKDNVGVWKGSEYIKTLSSGAVVRVSIIGMGHIGPVVESLVAIEPEAIGTLNTGEQVRMADLKKVAQNQPFNAKNIIIGIIIIIAACFLYKKFKK
jgi:hypothetical protein